MKALALIVGAAPEPGGTAFYTDLLAVAPVVIAADAAAEWCVELGRRPDLAVGDFDSARPGAAERLAALGVPVEVHPAIKDASDLDLCVGAARRLGCDSIAFTAAFSGRLDHTLAALGTVVASADLSPIVLEADMTAWLLDGSGRARVCLDLPTGTTFSLLAPAGASGVAVTGSRYTLQSGDLDALSSRGLSNLSAEGPVDVAVGEGSLFVLVQSPVGVREWSGTLERNT